MSEKMPKEIYVCGVGWKGKEGLSAVSCPDTYSHQEKYHHDDKYRALEEKYKDMVKFYDKHAGTPCEQIRHAEQVSALEAEVERLREAIRVGIYALESMNSGIVVAAEGLMREALAKREIE